MNPIDLPLPDAGVPAHPAPSAGAQNAIHELLAASGPVGGLAGLGRRFDQAGLSAVLVSWLAGAPRSISSDTLLAVLGTDALARLSTLSGLAPDDLVRQLASHLPRALAQLRQGQASPSFAR